MGTPSALTPTDLPLDERDLCPGRSPNLSISSRQSEQRANLQTHRPNSYLHNEKLIPSSSSRGVRLTVFNHELGKTKAKMLAAVMCVERNAPVLSLTELCKNGSVETFAWYSAGPQPPSAQAEHTLNGMLVHIHTHTKPNRSCPEDFLITLSEWEAVRHTQSQPPGLSHTPPRLPVLLPNNLFLVFIYNLFSSEGVRCMGGIMRRRLV